MSEDWLKAEYVLLLSGYVSWEDEVNIDTFRFGVFASEPVYTELSFKSQSQDFKDRPFRVDYYSRREEIRPVHVLYVGEKKNSSLKKLWGSWKDDPVLFVTDSAKNTQYSMINLLGMNMGGEPFEINKSNIDAASLTVSAKILAVGGSEEDLRSIYKQSERELERLKSDISELNEELELKQRDLENSIGELNRRSEEINSLNQEISLQTRQLESLSSDIDARQRELAQKILQMQEQEVKVMEREKEIASLNTDISEREQEIRSRSETMAEQQKNIREQKRLMNEQEAILDEQTLQIQWQKNAIIFFIIFSVLVIMMGFFIYRAYRVKMRANRILREKNRIIQEQHAAISNQKEEISAQRDMLQIVNIDIEKKNENITASIYYALTIQQAMLPDPEEIGKHFDSFIIYYPKDIVSGDFYWFSHLGRKKSGEETSFIAVVDCTGHGVPGGFLSMIGARMLSAIINENKVHETDRILEIMDQRVKQALNQHKTENDDGMDISLCRIFRPVPEPGGKQEVFVSYSGAHQHLLLVRNKQEIETVRASRRTIGGKHFNPEPYSKKELVLSPGDIIYLSTDGLKDQHSPARERFGTKRLVSLLNGSRDLGMQEQKSRIEEAMIGFMKTEKQRDDITILGLKL